MHARSDRLFETLFLATPERLLAEAETDFLETPVSLPNPKSIPTMAAVNDVFGGPIKIHYWVSEDLEAPIQEVPRHLLRPRISVCQRPHTLFLSSRSKSHPELPNLARKQRPSRLLRPRRPLYQRRPPLWRKLADRQGPPSSRENQLGYMSLCYFTRWTGDWRACGCD